MKQMYRVAALAVVSAFLAAGCASSGDTKKDEIQLKYKATDADKANKALATKVADKLKAEPQLANQYIFPSANDGVVTLTGVAKTSWQSYLAGKLAKSTDGVKSVKNNIKVD